MKEKNSIIKSKTISKMSISVKAKEKNEHIVRQVVSSFLDQLDISTEKLSDISRAIKEVFLNCVRHAYADEKGNVLVRASIRENDLIYIVISDTGCGIANAEEVISKSANSNGGFARIKNYADEVYVTSITSEDTLDDKGGTIVTLVFDIKE